MFDSNFVYFNIEVMLEMIVLFEVEIVSYNSCCVELFEVVVGLIVN